MTSPAPDDPLAELADLVLNVSRLIRARTPTGTDVVPMTETERTVMRVVDLYPSSSPSEIARRAGLQRTNVSTALRTLEEKHMITRTVAGGRGVAVSATARAGENLRVLRSAWSRQLLEAVGDDTTSVRKCNEVLTWLERRLTEGGTHDVDRPPVSGGG